MNKPCWVLNGTTLVMGGALQACVNFIIEAAKDECIDWRFLVSLQIKQQLLASDSTLPPDKLQVFPVSPAKNRAMRADIKQAVESISPVVVFTFFGPSYIEFNCQHVLGFADSWVLNSNKYAISTLKGLSSKIRTYLLGVYKIYWLKKADYWVVETSVAKSGLARAINCNLHDVAVIANGCHDVFRGLQVLEFSPDHFSIRLLCLSAYYPHKNFELIPEVAKALTILQPDRKFIFVLSLSLSRSEVKAISDRAVELGVADCLEFIGAVDLDKVPELYGQSHMAFIPTLLEAFSAAYSEAMTCRLPIVTSDLDFARAVCVDGALYFEPKNAQAAAKAIVECVQDANLRERTINNASLVASTLPNAYEKYMQYKEFIAKKITN